MRIVIVCPLFTHDLVPGLNVGLLTEFVSKTIGPGSPR